MKRMLLCAVGGLLAGCDYTVPLVKTPETAIDRGLVGLWQRVGEEGKEQRLLVLPLSKVEYLIVFPAGEEDAMYAKGCIWRGASLMLLQLDWFATAQAKFPENDRTFQYASFVREGDTLKFRLLNPDIVSRDLASTDALTKAITENKDDPKLFGRETVFQRVKDETE